MADNQATVEVLTAEVRTLVVGKRQVTMSVFKQLDAVAPSALEPFGRVSYEEKRVRTNWGYGDDTLIWVVGRSLRTGALVRASQSRYLSDRYSEEQEETACVRYERWAALPLIVLAGLR